MLAATTSAPTASATPAVAAAIVGTTGSRSRPWLGSSAKRVPVAGTGGTPSAATARVTAPTRRGVARGVARLQRQATAAATATTTSRGHEAARAP